MYQYGTRIVLQSSILTAIGIRRSEKHFLCGRQTLPDRETNIKEDKFYAGLTDFAANKVNNAPADNRLQQLT